MAVEFLPTFEFKIDITLAIFWEKLQNHIHINRTIHYEIKAL